MSGIHAASGDVITLSGSHLTYVVVVAVIALGALGVAALLVREVLAASPGTEKMQEIAAAVQEGAAAYLARQFKTLSVFAVVVFFLLFLLPAETTSERVGRSVFFLIGASFSAITGYVGMWLAVRGNVRVAAAAQESGEQRAMRIAFRTGGVAGMFTVGLGLFGAAIVVIIYKENAAKVLEGFGFGAAMLAMFMRVGGGIFTKAADVGADLVGKVEQGIPEDDPRNAATIADNVGDNVGDCAGMAADLFESYAVTLVAALILGKAAFGDLGLVSTRCMVPAIGVHHRGRRHLRGRPARQRPLGHERPSTAASSSPRAISVGPRGDHASYTLPARSRITSINERRRSTISALVTVDTFDPRLYADRRRDHRHRARRRDPAAHRVLHRDQPQAGQRRLRSRRSPVRPR